MEIAGYPSILIYILLAIGLLLAFLRPYEAFILATLLIGAGDTQKFNATRTALLGPFLNLTDVCVLVSLAALMFDCLYRRKWLRIPLVVTLILFILHVSYLQSVVAFGSTYETIRAARWALQFPLGIFIAANLVTETRRVKSLVWTLLAASVASSVLHLIYIAGARSLLILNMDNYYKLRTISFSSGGLSESIFITAAVWKLPRKILAKASFLMIGGLILTSIIMNQTRSIWIAVVVSLLFVIALYQQKAKVLAIFRLAVIIFAISIIAVLLARWLVPELDFIDIVTERLYLLTDTIASDGSIGSRSRSFKIEINSWLEGTWILGRGLFFFQTMDAGDPNLSYTFIGFGHLGYVTYLSQLGLIGIFIYAIYLPLSVIRNSRHVWFSECLLEENYLALLAGVCMIFNCITFVMSSSFLGIGYFIPGILTGAVWSLERRNRVDMLAQLEISGLPTV